ncbi:hypothetical protein O181_013068 [Austropuccinia psidii MF-1]|uniref:Uncharacterized protein n=1 Tax=Austropuccinia psidii MF-1 TaxID=1389203 RepID=A0A9Q3BYI4_9BASI|nr:hypothetical protein [Austropuccinia psidii MF-1]
MASPPIPPEVFEPFLDKLVDVHCHPSDAAEESNLEQVASEISQLQVGQLCIMSSSLSSQEITEKLFNLQPSKIIPAFGLHPWFCATVSISNPVDRSSHYCGLFGENEKQKQWVEDHIHLLPDPVNFNEFLSHLKLRLESEPTSLLGEVGLDKAFSFQFKLSDGSFLKSGLKIPIDHQLAVLEAQLDLAVRLSKNVSLHGVHCQDQIIQLLQRLEKRWGAKLTGAKQLSKRQRKAILSTESKPSAIDDQEHGIHICWHSAFVSVEVLKRAVKLFPNTLYFSFAFVLFENKNISKLHDLIKYTPNDRLLVESDWSDQPKLIDQQIIRIIEIILEVKGWTLERCIHQLEINWKNFQLD